MGVYGILNASAGWTECEITGALPAAFLNGCSAAGVTLLAAMPADAFTLRVRLSIRDVEKAKRIALRAQCTLHVLGTCGAPRWKKTLLRRIVPAVCCLLLVAGLVWSKLFLWEIGVTGNETVPTAAILSALRECGVDCGSFWPAFTSDQIRSELLLELPELAWATVNVHGSRAEVIVRERVPKPVIFDPDVPTDVIAAKTGFITGLQVLRGAPQVQRGSAVTTGETIISGAVGSKYSGTYLVHAVGSAEAETYYELSAKLPSETLRKSENGKKTVHYALLLGKNRYNFYRNSSIPGHTCDKIISVYNIGIKGLFSLPISLVRETETEYVLTPRRADAPAAVRQMQEELYACLLTEIGPNGTVEEYTWTKSEAGGCITVCLRARCSEQIAAEMPMNKDKILQIKEEKP